MKVLANYLDQLPDNKGWCYWILEYNIDIGKVVIEESKIDCDKAMSCFGTLFRLTEVASDIILIEMGCLKVEKAKKRTINMNKGRDKLKNEFPVKKGLI